MKYTTSRMQDGCLVISIERDIDHHNAAILRGEIDEEIGLNNPKSVVLDFEAVEFMDSSGIGLIMGRYKKIHESGGELVITGLNRKCKKLVEISGINEFIGIF